jgi:GNAT superfamily N-acetyltransferase
VVDAAPAAALTLTVVGWDDPDAAVLRDKLTRMFVRREWRGRGLSRLVLGELEDHARAQGLHRVVPETGNLQTAAIALCERSGYVRIAPYGGYADSPLSLCYAKDLTA